MANLNNTVVIQLKDAEYMISSHHLTKSIFMKKLVVIRVGAMITTQL